MNTKYNSQYTGEELNTAVGLLDKSWIQLEISGGTAGKSVTVTPGQNCIATNLIPSTSLSSTSYWTKNNCSYSIYARDTAIQYRNYDVIIATSSGSESRLTKTFTLNTDHIYYMQAFVDGVNSNESIHGIRIEDASDSSRVYMSYMSNNLNAMGITCRGKVGNNNVKLALCVNVTDIEPVQTRSTKAASGGTGYCCECGGTYSYSVAYEYWTSKIHAIRHWCSNCGYDQTGGAMSEDHTFNYYGTCTKCGYYDASKDNGTYNDYQSSSSYTPYTPSTPQSTVDDTIEVHFGRLALLDLTDCFGAGNEPTHEWCDDHIDFNLENGKYHSALLIKNDTSKYQPITGTFDNSGKCLINLPGFGYWTVGVENETSGEVLVDTYNQIEVNEVKRYYVQL